MLLTVTHYKIDHSSRDNVVCVALFFSNERQQNQKLEYKESILHTVPCDRGDNLVKNPQSIEVIFHDAMLTSNCNTKITFSHNP